MGEGSGEEDFLEIINAIEENPPYHHRMLPEDIDDRVYITPEGTQNPEPPSSNAPFLPNVSAARTSLPTPPREATTPTPSGHLIATSM